MFKQTLIDGLTSLPDGGLHTWFNLLRDSGWEIEHTYYVHCVSLYKTIWEHPLVAKHNENAHVLSTYFFTLYEVEDNDIDLPPFYFSTGRIGNTNSYLITPPIKEKTKCSTQK